MPLTLVAPYPDSVDMPAILRTLTEAGLRASTHTPLLVDASGALPHLDTQPAHIEVSYLSETSTGFYATVWDACGGPELAELLFALADVGHLVITPDPAPPHIVTCGKYFADDDIVNTATPPWQEVCVRARSAPELQQILAGSWQDYRITLADQVWGSPDQWP